MIDITRCQYCFYAYDYCTCCEFCGERALECDCQLKSDPCTQLHPSDMYQFFSIDPDMCRAFGIFSVEDLDKRVMETYKEDCWPDRLKIVKKEISD